MRRLIVEAPELKEGQTDSSGEIRERGKISVQYKTPVPYREPELPPVILQTPYTRSNQLKNQASDLAADVVIDILSMLWYEYGKPFIKAKLHQLGYMATVYHETPSRIIENKSTKITKRDVPEYDDEIIHFTKKHAS